MAEPASSSPAATPASEAPTSESTQSTSPESPTPPPVDAPTDAPQNAPADEDEFSFPDELPATPEEAKPEAPQAEAKPEDELGDLTGKLPKEVQEAFLKTNRGRKLYNGFRLAQEMLKPPEQGGLGRLPSVEEVREFHQAAQDMRLMQHEFNHGDPVYAQNWVKNWFQPGPQGYTEGARQVARNLVPTIAEMARSNPQAAEIYRSIAAPVALEYVEEWYRRAASEPTREERITAFNVARLMEQDLTGRYRDIPEAMLDPGYRSPQQAANPQDAELAGKIQYINKFEETRRTEAAQQFERSMGQAIFTKVDADVKAALKGLDATMGANTFAALEKQFMQEVYQSVQNNPLQLRNFLIARDEARRANTPEAIQAAAAAWHSVARPIVRQLRAKYMAENGERLVARSAERHATLDAASQKRGTTGVAQPTGKNLATGPLERQAGESHEDFVRRRVEAAISA